MFGIFRIGKQGIIDNLRDLMNEKNSLIYDLNNEIRMMRDSAVDQNIVIAKLKQASEELTARNKALRDTIKGNTIVDNAKASTLKINLERYDIEDYCFSIVSRNGNQLALSDRYKTKRAAMRGINILKENLKNTEVKFEDFTK